jgi:hypothetical protein
MTSEDDVCKICDGTGEVSVTSPLGNHEYAGCPGCIEREKNEKIEELTARILELGNCIQFVIDTSNPVDPFVRAVCKIFVQSKVAVPLPSREDMIDIDGERG